MSSWIPLSLPTSMIKQLHLLLLCLQHIPRILSPIAPTAPTLIQATITSIPLCAIPNTVVRMILSISEIISFFTSNPPLASHLKLKAKVPTMNYKAICNSVFLPSTLLPVLVRVLQKNRTSRFYIHTYIHIYIERDYFKGLRNWLA